MATDVFEYYSHDDWSLMKAEMDRHETPFLVVNLNIVRRNYEALRSLYPFAHIYYAVKANPATEVLTLLRDLPAEGGRGRPLARPGRARPAGASVRTDGNRHELVAKFAQTW